MKRALAILCGALLALYPLGAMATSIALTGAGTAPTGGGGGGYTGPGDVQAFAHFYGVRAVTGTVAASGTAKALKVRNTSTAETCDVLLASAGGLGNTTGCSGASSGTAVATFCGANCVVVTLYDQVVTGGTWDTTQATTTKQPALTFNCVSTLPCLTFNGTSAQTLVSSSVTVSQPMTISAVAIRTSHFTTQNDIISGANGVFFNTSANTIGTWFGASTSTTANDGAWHALHFVVNSSSSAFNVDGTFTSGQNWSTGALDTGWQIGAQQNTADPLYGSIAEVGIVTSALNSTVTNNLCHNQSAYYGLGLSC